jgi:hypothetical protein
MNMGKRALLNDPEVNAKNVANLSPGDKQFYLSGVTRALQNKIEGAQDGADVTRKIFGNDLIRNKIAAAFDDPKAFAQFEQRMEAEAQFAQTRNDVLKGSQTARRLAGQADSAAPIGDVVRHALSGNIVAAAASGTRGIANYLLRPSENQLAAQGHLLFTPNGAGPWLQALENAKPGPIGKTVNALTQAGKRSALPAATIAAHQAYGR